MKWKANREYSLVFHSQNLNLACQKDKLKTNTIGFLIIPFCTQICYENGRKINNKFDMWHLFTLSTVFTLSKRKSHKFMEIGYNWKILFFNWAKYGNFLLFMCALNIVIFINLLSDSTSFFLYSAARRWSHAMTELYLYFIRIFDA